MAFILHKLAFDKKNKKQHLNFNIEILNSNIVFSIIIGANGTGKSLLLQKLIYVFRELDNLRHRSSSKYESLDYYLIEYSIDNYKYKIEKNMKNFFYFKNDKEVSINEVQLPESMLALSFLQEDKFVFQANDKKSFYKYLGARNTANAVFVGTINKKIREILFEHINKQDFANKMVDTLDILGYEPRVKINFDYKLKSIATTKITVKKIDQKIRTINKKSEFKHIELSRQEKDEIIGYVHSKRQELSEEKGKLFTSVVIDFNSLRFPVEEYRLIKNMLKIDFISQSGIELYQKGAGVNSEYLSSGEKNLLFITLNILANATNNSLLLIDEPEISLHPNWQLKYNMHLKKILSNFKNIHIVIATHSHFLLSGLKQEELNVFKIKKDKTINEIKEDIHGWSPENILYNVFGMASTRNYYFERDLKKLVYFISNKKGSIEEIEDILDKLKKFNITDDDPLKHVILSGESYLKTRVSR